MLQLCVYRSKMLSTIYRNMYIYIYLSIYLFMYLILIYVLIYCIWAWSGLHKLTRRHAQMGSTEVHCSKAIDNSISRMMFCSILQVWVALLSTSNILVWYSNGRCYRLQYCKIETACLVLFVWISSPMVGKSSVATRLHNRLGTRNCCIKSAKSVQCSHRMEKNHKD